MRGGGDGDGGVGHETFFSADQSKGTPFFGLVKKE